MRPYLLAPRFAANRLWLAAREVPSWHIAPVRTGTVTDLISGSQIITFTNSSPAWGFNSSGILVQPTANVPFIEYDPATGSALGWRVWDAVTNLALHSRDLTQTAWVKSGITPTRDQVGADGTANMATRLTATSSDGTALQTITSASATRASGFLIKRITGTGVIQITQDGGATWNTVSITNQWLRYPIAAATVTNPQIGFRIRSSGDEIAVDFAQLQSSSTLGPPVETGALTASSTADVASIAGAAFAGIWNDVESTVVCRFFSDNTAGSGRTSLLFDVGAGGAFGTTGYGVFNTSGWFINPTTAPMNLQSAVAVSAGTKAIGTMAARFKANDSRIAVNGTLGSLDSSCAVPASPTTLSIGRSGWSASVNYANGYIQELAILKSGRPDPNLTAISAT
jgi:hypothetical protein